MKKIYFGILCLVMFSCNYDEQFDDLNQDLNLLNERLDSLNDELVAVRTAVAELAGITNELDLITAAIKSLEDSSGLNDLNALDVLTSGLQNLRDKVTVLENTIGEDNTALLDKIKELQDALEVANANGDDSSALITQEIATLEEQLMRETDTLATNVQMQSLLQDIVEVRTSLSALLSQNAFFNGNVTIRSLEDL